MKDYHRFFSRDVPAMLSELQTDAKAQWGSMPVMEMPDHLRKGIVMSLEDRALEITTPEEHLPAYRRFLMSDKLFKKGSPMPEFYNSIKPYGGNLTELKAELMKTVKEMLDFFENNPGHTAVHPSFGRLNVTEWLQLHYKHFLHHFTQFGLVENA